VPVAGDVSAHSKPPANSQMLAGLILGAVMRMMLKAVDDTDTGNEGFCRGVVIGAVDRIRHVLHPRQRRAAARQIAREAAVDHQFNEPGAPIEYAAAHDGWSPDARFYCSRLHVVSKLLSQHPGGFLLDVGCGPGVLVDQLSKTRPGVFTITACDRSPAMVEAVAKLSSSGEHVQTAVASIEHLPFADRRFDVVLALGVLEYVDCRNAVRELSRVCRPGGFVVLSMLNPFSPYRLFEWCVYWPALRIAGRLERIVGVPDGDRHGACRSGMQTVRRGKLCQLIREVGLMPEEVVYYDVNALVPPFDRIVRRWCRGWREQPERTIGKGARRWLGTGLVIAGHLSET
jgi:ubiquinone/menaquinone biosynthesis C-methylase UbiE